MTTGSPRIWRSVTGAVSHTYIIIAIAAVVIEFLTFCRNGKGEGCISIFVVSFTSVLKITTGMKDHGLIQLPRCVKAKDYGILHGTRLVDISDEYKR